MAGDEDAIVICGMGCRLPGEVKSPSQFWDLIISGGSAQSNVPANRFDISRWHHPDPKRRGGIIARGGYFLSHDDEYRNFDPSFFGISSLEAASLDPQQRKLLEVVYETFESAGVTLGEISGSQTACYVGAFTADFGKTLQRELEDYWPYQSTGTDMTILSNRVNYVFNLKGPSLTVDTACSSSLYALHLACQGLLLHDFDAAVVAGTNIIMDVLHQSTATKLGILSPTSTCHTFDESADGFGRAEGMTALYIKRMSDAIANNDPIRAVIRSTAINTNGKGVGISHPGVQGQESVIRQAYRKARLGFDETAYLECHGTGTPVGDPIEVTAAGNVFALGRSTGNPILLSSVKSQIGHTEGASGIAAVQKVVMALENRVVPATIGIKNLNPALDLKGGRVKIVQRHQPWPSGYRRAGVNSFGYGGANAHLIIDAADSYFERRGMSLSRTWMSMSQSKPAVAAAAPAQLLVTSAHSAATLQANISSISQLTKQVSLRSLAHTLSTKRTPFHHRAFTIIPPNPSISLSPSSWTTSTNTTNSTPSTSTHPRIAFIFTGQGAQWPLMGLPLYHQFPAFRSSFISLQTALSTLIPPPLQPPWTLLSALSSPPATYLMMTDITVTVTLCTALQICLIDLLSSWHVHPTAVLGHSSGEAAAAYASGLLTRDETIITSYYRALAMKLNPNPNSTPEGMMAVGLGASEAEKYIHPHQLKGREIYIGCRNSPESVTVSGRMDVIDDLERELKTKGIFVRKVKSSGFANHCPLVERAAEWFRMSSECRDALKEGDGMMDRKEKCRMYSCITAGRVRDGERGDVDLGVEYWSKNISAQVMFDEALRELIKQEGKEGVDYLIEIGPHKALEGPIRQTKAVLGLGMERMKYLGSLIRGKDGVEDMMRLAGELWLAGCEIDLGKVNEGIVGEGEENENEKGKFIVDLPGYQWTYDQMYWSESRVSREWLRRKHPRHDLLGSRDPASTATTIIWKNKLALSDVPWIADHRIGKSVLVPAAAYVAMAIEAMRQVSEDGGLAVERFVLEDVNITTPIRLEEKEREAVETSFELSVANRDRKKFRLASVTLGGMWTEHASGYISTDETTQGADPHKPTSGNHSGIKASELYSRFQKLGLNYGPCFRTLGDVQRPGGGRAQAKINSMPTEGSMKEESKYLIHPATMDGCFQLAFAAVLDESQITQRSYLPSVIPTMTIWNTDITSSEGGDTMVEGGAIICGLRTVDADFRLSQQGRMRMSGEVRFIAVEGLVGAVQEEVMPEPYSCLTWYPDIEMMEGEIEEQDLINICAPDPVSVETSKVPNGHLSHPKSDQKTSILKMIVEMIAFKRPDTAILQIGSTSKTKHEIMQAIRTKARYPAAKSFIAIDAAGNAESVLSSDSGAPDQTNIQVVDFTGSLKEQGFPAASIDLFVLSNLPTGHTLQGLIDSAIESLSTEAHILLAKPYSEHHSVLTGSGWEIQLTTPNRSVTLLKRSSPTPTTLQPTSQPILWLLSTHPPQFLQSFHQTASLNNIQICPIHLSQISTLPKGATVISLLESSDPILSDINAEQIRQLQFLFKQASLLVWVTTGEDPRMALMAGMAKTLKMEYPGLGIVDVNIDGDMAMTMKNACGGLAADVVEMVLKIAMRRCVDHDDGDEKVEEQSILIKKTKNDNNYQVWISRYALDEERNLDDLAKTKGVMEEGRFEGEELQLDMRKIGQLESFFFKETRSNGTTLTGNQVRIAPFAFGISRDAAMTLKGMRAGRFFSLECLGTVKETVTGSEFQVGDKVLCLAGSMIESEMVVLETSCLKCKNETQAKQLIGSTIPFLKAYVALVKVGKMRAGDVVVVRTSDELFKDTVCGLVNFLKGKMMSDLKNEVKGIDILIDDEGGDLRLSDDVTKRLTLGARVIETQATQHDLGLASATEKGEPPRNSVNLEKIMLEEPAIVNEALGLMTNFVNNSDRKKLPTAEVFWLNELPAAVAIALDSATHDRVIIRCGSETAVPIHRIRKSHASFSDAGAYLLVGCLGGLGRSITLWMKEHGARHFVFLSRSGADKPEAAALVEKLRADSKTTVAVVRGDVCSREDVRRAVRKAGRPIRGVVQASTVFDETRFEQMTPERWRYVLGPKVLGTMNLHHETLGQPLDFFVMTSSSIGLLGATTQTHYAASNKFLDAMARYRHQLGVPGTALALGMIVGAGRFEEDNTLTDVLHRRGAYGISEREFLGMMEQACFGDTQQDNIIGAPERSTLVTALDPTKFLDTQAVPEWVVSDPKLRHIHRAISHLKPEQTPSTANGTNASSQLRALAASTEPDHTSLVRLTQTCVFEKLSSMLLTPVDKLEDSLQRPLSELGMDSLVGTELQAWLWRELRVSLDFMELFGSQKSLGGFVQLVADELMAK